MTPSDTSLGAQRPPPHWSRRDRVPSAGWAASLWDWAIVVLLALLVVLFFWRILTPNLSDRASFPPGDFSYQFWAFSTFEARELSAGRLPLWNPYTYAGSPFWADIQSAVLYLPSLLTLLLSGPWGFSLFALEVEAIAHFWLAGVFTYLFVRRLTRHRGAALFAAITFTFGGYLTGYPSQQLAVLETDVWLPLMLYFADRGLVDRSGEAPRLHPQISLPHTLAAGLSWGMALLAGHPQSAMFTLYALTLYVVFLALALRPPSRGRAPSAGWAASRWETKRRIRKSVTYWVLIILIGLGISAIAWLPGLEYMRLSVRAAGFYDKMSGGFPLYDPIQMLLPGSVSFYSPLYVGVLPLLLAMWAALSRPAPLRKLRQPETIFWGALAAGAFLLSFGDETFLYTPFYLLIPGFSIFRDQERLAFVVSFALAVLAGYGFKYQISNIKYQVLTANLQSVVGWLLVGAVGLVVLFFYGLNSVGWLDDSPFNLLLSRSVWLTIMLALTWGTMWATRSWGLRAKDREPGTAPYSLLPTPYSLLPLSFLLIAALDLFTVNWKTNVYPALPETQTAMPAVVQAIQTDASPGEVFRVYNEYRIYENYGVPYALEDTWGASPLRLARYDEMHRSLRMERLWELLNVKYVITWREELYAPSEIIYQEPAGDDVTYVHRLNQVAPRAWLVYQGQTVGEGATLARLDAFDFDPAQTALVPRGTPLPLENPPDGQNGQVEILRRTPTSTVLNVTTPTNCLLILSEVYYPGWRATVDDQTTPIVRTNYTLRGVPVPAGEHRVEVFFQPVTFVWGAVISGMTLIAVVVAGLWAWLRRKSPEREAGIPVG